MHFTKPFGMLAGAIMIALALAAPVIDGAADAVAVPAAPETLLAMAKVSTKHTTKAAKPHTTKVSKPHTTKPAKVTTAKAPKATTTKPAKVTTTKAPKATKTAKAPATKSSKTKPATSAKPVKPPVTKPVKATTSKPAKATTSKAAKATTSKPAKPTTAKSAKATPTKPVKSAPTKSVKSKPTKSVKARPTKSAKPKPSQRPASKSTKPHGTKSAKPSGKPAPTKLPSNSTSAAPPTASSPTSCALPPKTTKKTSVRRAYDAVLRLFQRDQRVFIGWHGTNDKTATLWTTTGHIVKPPSSAAGSSGADAEFGNGLYVADWAFSATFYANGNAANNNNLAEKAGKPKDYTPKVCAIYAKSQSNWLSKTQKILLPTDLKGNGNSAEKARIAYIKKTIVGPPTIDPTTVQRFAELKLPTDRPDATDGSTLKGQLILVNGQDYEADCFDPAADGGPPAGAQSVRNYPEFAYMGYSLQQEWHVTGMLKNCA